MKILYLENSKDLDGFITKIKDVSNDDANFDPFLAPSLGYDFDHILLDIKSFSSFVFTSQNNVSEDFLFLNSLVIHKNSNKVEIGNKKITLTKREHDMLILLGSNYPRITSRDVLAVKIWGRYSNCMSNTIEVHLNKLRKKIGKDRIICIKGFGYKLNVD